MSSRMDKYDVDIPELKSRTSRNKDLYMSSDVDYDKFDVNSNVSVLKNNAREIDVNQIREMLDKKYRDSLPRKSIDIPKYEEVEEKDPLEDTKEYDLNTLLNKAKESKEIDYDKERLTKKQNSEDLINTINEKYNKTDETEDEDLKDLINTITALEIKNKQKDAEFLDLADDDQTDDNKTGIIVEKNESEDFYTGQLSVTEDDFDDFKDMQDDIKSNSVFVKILAFIFILILIGAIIFVANNIFDLGLF